MQSRQYFLHHDTIEHLVVVGLGIYGSQNRRETASFMDYAKAELKSDFVEHLVEGEQILCEFLPEVVLSVPILPACVSGHVKKGSQMALLRGRDQTRLREPHGIGRQVTGQHSKLNRLSAIKNLRREHVGSLINIDGPNDEEILRDRQALSAQQDPLLPNWVPTDIRQHRFSRLHPR